MSEPNARHAPVLLQEAIAALAPVDGGLYIDATFGAGGYSRALLSAANTRVIGLDRDPTTAPAGAALRQASGERFTLVETEFSRMDAVIADAGGADVAGVVMDVGVSSMQIDQAERGFSFRQEGPLDMRMARRGPSAADVVNTLDAEALASIFFILGEERRSRRIAAAIVAARAEAPLLTTLALANLVEGAVGRGDGRIHPATRVFQALRIYVNDELGELERGLAAAEEVLAPGGRLVVVSFHSLEDRIVKAFLRDRSGAAAPVSRHQPTLPANDPSGGQFRLLFNGTRTPGEAEIAENPRARSAKLRAAVRTSAPARAGVSLLAPRVNAPALEAIRPRT